MMKSLSYLFLICLSAIAFMGCPQNPDEEMITETGDVELLYRAQFGDEPLLMAKNYNYPNDTLIQFQKFQFYISDIVLLSGSEETELKEVSLIEFNNIATNATAEAGIRDIIPSIPTGEYTSIRLSIGVPADLNVSNNYPTSHPLGKNFWDDWGSYIFMRIDGSYDEDNSGDFVGAETFALHTGSNAVYQTITLPMPISILEGDTTSIQIDFDLMKLFKPNESTNLYDLGNNPSLHSPDKADIMKAIMDNFSAAISVR